jgi:predicted ATPase
MVKRIYVDNFRCLVNFELKLDRVNLLLGGSGSGKTTVFDVLYRLQQFLAGNAQVLAVFPSTELTRSQTSLDTGYPMEVHVPSSGTNPPHWQTNTIQRFELDIEISVAAYNYALVIEHDEDRRRAKVKSETLTLGGRKLFDFQDGMAQLYHDDFTQGPAYPFDWTRSGVGVLQPRPDNKQLTRFRGEVQKLIVVGPQPVLMTSETREESATLSRYMENFVSWYRFLSQEHQGAVLAIFPELKRVLPGFNACNLKEAGEARVMKVLFDQPGGAGRPIPYDFKELSDGQRMLIALYSLLFGLKGEGVSLFLDEPDNFVALREIQPWLMALTDCAGEGIEQAVLISHHPEIINYLAASSGRWFERDTNAPARVSDKPKTMVEDLTMAETVARGWEK